MAVPIARQIAAVEVMRRRAPDQDTLDGLAAAEATLRIVAANADGMRELIRFLRSCPRWTEEEATALVRHPAIAALLEAFPEAIIEAIRRPAMVLSHDESDETD